MKPLSPARRRDLLDSLGRIHARILDDVEACSALEEVMLASGFLSEEASNRLPEVA